eukprot:GHVR01093772.1.p1 GENE.GHVR01093772.1~~GHVR01093772.1.p1  ORF type:complete len:117 (-),score=25.63 GHVR01093772.1:115-465(-)
MNFFTVIVALTYHVTTLRCNALRIDSTMSNNYNSQSFLNRDKYLNISIQDRLKTTPLQFAQIGKAKSPEESVPSVEPLDVQLQQGDPNTTTIETDGSDDGRPQVSSGVHLDYPPDA